jgi:hypothetical protein
VVVPGRGWFQDSKRGLLLRAGALAGEGDPSEKISG